MGVVLAAGFGSRLAAEGDASSTKPLLVVGNRPLFDRTLHSLEVAGCRAVVIVVGHEAELLQRRIEVDYTGPLPLIFAHNPDYQLSNGLSVLCAAPHVGDEFVLTMADHVLGDELMRLARDHHPPPDGATLCVDYKLDTIFDMDDATKVLANHGFIGAIGKEIPTTTASTPASSSAPAPCWTPLRKSVSGRATCPSPTVSRPSPPTRRCQS